MRLIFRGREWVIYEHNGDTFRKSIVTGDVWRMHKKLRDWVPVDDLDKKIAEVLKGLPK